MRSRTLFVGLASFLALAACGSGGTAGLKQTGGTLSTGGSGGSQSSGGTSAGGGTTTSGGTGGGGGATARGGGGAIIVKRASAVAVWPLSSVTLHVIAVEPAGAPAELNSAVAPAPLTVPDAAE